MYIISYDTQIMTVDKLYYLIYVKNVINECQILYKKYPFHHWRIINSKLAGDIYIYIEREREGYREGETEKSRENKALPERYLRYVCVIT